METADQEAEPKFNIDMDKEAPGPFHVFTWAVGEGPGRPLLGATRCGARAIVEMLEGEAGTKLKVSVLPREGEGFKFGLGPVKEEQMPEATRVLDVVLRRMLFQMQNEGREATPEELATWSEDPKRAWTQKKAEKYWRRQGRRNSRLILPGN